MVLLVCDSVLVILLHTVQLIKLKCNVQGLLSIYIIEMAKSGMF